MLGIPTLVIDVNKAVGDNWRKRYHQLVLHDPVWYDHMPYLPFPDSWPVFTPKDKLADWFESYVKALDLDVWTQSQLVSSRWDDAAKQWTVEIRRTRPDGQAETRTFHPKHLVLATGHAGKAYMPAIPGMDSFQGDLLKHSGEFPGASEAGKGRKAVVVGACNSSMDICQDYVEKGYDVTVVQRSSTFVLSVESSLKVALGVLYEEGGPPVEDSDVAVWGWPSEVLKSINVDVTTIAGERDKEMLDGLERAGFKTDKGPSAGGIFCKYLQRAMLPPWNQSPGCPLPRQMVLISPSSSQPQTSPTASGSSSPRMALAVVLMLSYPVANTISSASSSLPSANRSPLGKICATSWPCLTLTLPSMISLAPPTSM